MSHKLFALLCLAAAALAFAACDDDDGDNKNPDTTLDATSTPDTTEGDATEGDTTPTNPDATDDTDDTDQADGTPDADPDTVAPIDPLEVVPPEPFPGDADACGAAFTAVAGQNEGFMVGDEARSFYLALPDASEHTGPRPLFVAFHGTDGTGQGAFTGWNLQPFVDAGFIVLALDGEDNGGLWPTWDAMHQANDDQSMNPDLAFFDAAVSCLAAQQSVDAKRVYVGGHSAGGIMTNHVLRSRSPMLAGGIVASGIYDLTAPDPVAPLDPMTILVTWGGDNDGYSGTTNSGVELPSFNFAEQAAIASAAYENAPGVAQAYCTGNDFGHVWLESINSLMVDYLLAHPKGLTENESFVLPTAPATGVRCSEGIAEFVPPIVVECVEESSVRCLDYCQFIGDCVVENSTAGPVLGPQLEALGFSGEGRAECGGCLTACEQDEAAAFEVDEGVLTCFQDAFQTHGAMCGPGVPGVMPFINAANTCCEDQLDSAVCTRLCTTVKENNIALQLLPTCEAF